MTLGGKVTKFFDLLAARIFVPGKLFKTFPDITRKH